MATFSDGSFRSRALCSALEACATNTTSESQRRLCAFFACSRECSLNRTRRAHTARAHKTRHRAVTQSFARRRNGALRAQEPARDACSNSARASRARRASHCCWGSSALRGGRARSVPPATQSYATARPVARRLSRVARSAAASVRDCTKSAAGPLCNSTRRGACGRRNMGQLRLATTNRVRTHAFRRV